MHMQQTHTKSRKTTMAFYSRTVGAVIGLTLMFVTLSSFAPSAMNITGSKAMVKALPCADGVSNDCETPDCTPSSIYKPGTPCFAIPPQEITNNCPKGQCIIDKYLQPAINLVSALVGIAVAASIIRNGIRYSTSGDNSQKVSEAKQGLVTAAFVLVGYFTFFAFMNYLIPGGLL